MSDPDGAYETHFSVQLADDGLARLGAWGAARGLKCTHIVLSRGRSPSQPMLTRTGRGSLSSALERASSLAVELDRDGFEVTRVKVEAATRNGEVPRSDADARAQPSRYFEHHVKLLLGPEADTAAIVEVAERNAAHLSRNALRVRADGRHERFVTQRCYSVGRETALRRLDRLVTELRAVRLEIQEIEEEYVVYDTNLELDAGWIVALERSR